MERTLTKEQPTTIRFRPETKQALDAFSEGEKRNRSNAVDFLVTDGLTKRGYLTKTGKLGAKSVQHGGEQ
jgi:hypothetical protein